MNNQYDRQRQTERHLKLWIYLLPVVGVIPAIWTLYKIKNNDQTYLDKHREEQKASRLSISLIFVWLCSYSLLSMGATNVEGITSFRLVYTNAIVTTGYFIVCTFLMSRLGKTGVRLKDEVN